MTVKTITQYTKNTARIPVEWKQVAFGFNLSLWLKVYLKLSKIKFLEVLGCRRGDYYP
jgi:hypothetical protein